MKKSYKLTIAVFLIVSLSLSSLFIIRKLTNKTLERNFSVQYKSIEGVNPDLLSFDVNLPMNESKNNGEGNPVIIWIHGGGWVIGDKANNIDNKITYFTELGYIFISVNYRLSPKNLTMLDPNRIKFPDFNYDVADAFAYIHSNCTYWNGDPSRIILMGHSAGAYLVSSISVDEKFLESRGKHLTNIKAAIVLDTAGFNVTLKVEEENPQQKLYINAFGIDRNITDDASPINHILKNSGIPPFLIFTEGSVERVEISENFGFILENNGVFAQVLNVTGLSHADINESIGNSEDNIITPAIVEFLLSLSL